MVGAKAFSCVMLLVLPCIACGDDDEPDGAHDAGQMDPAGGRSGRGGSGGRAVAGQGGVGGRGDPSMNCRAAVRDDLSAWCEMDRTTCDDSFDEALRRICKIVGPIPTTGTRANAYHNTCGGRSVGYTLAADVYAEYNHYDAAGDLIGVYAHPFSFPCSAVHDVYGMECQGKTDDSIPVDCSMFDADAGT
jgi:hypothetical protein